MPLPPLLRLLAVNGAFGFVLGAGLAVLLIVLNVARIGDLLSASEGVAGHVLLIAGFGLTFASLAMGSAIMMIGRRDED